ncbi:MAG TPA: GreA/GreB family elongation factor [Steroidobacteraceae bacterium]|nr:GreA/GreB family elongation factor [Steroidobacteraceae bacterium]
MRRNNRIEITPQDLNRLRTILASRNGPEGDREHLLDLRDELEQAHVVSEEEIADSVVTLQSRVIVRDRETGRSSQYTIVAPAQANVSLGLISVVAPLGTALLGYREGDEVEWQMPGGVRRLQIETVRQPHRLSSQPGQGHDSTAGPPAAA